MKRWLGLPMLLASIVVLTLNCGGGGESPPPPGQSSQLPIVSTGAAPTTPSSATLNASVNPNGLATIAYFEWGTSESLAGASRTADQTVGAGVTSVVINAQLTGLTISTTYYCRVVATNSAGSIRGTIVQFSTQVLGTLPDPLYFYADSVTANSARLYGGTGPSNSPATAYFEYSLDPSFVGALRTPDQVVNPGFGTNFSATITGLLPSTYYYFRTVATNVDGTSYSPFAPPFFPSAVTLTSPGWPEAITRNDQLVGSITATSAKVNGFIISSNPSTTVYFEYDTDFNFSNALRTTSQPINSTNGTEAIATLTGLSPATDYYYRAVATNATGTSLGYILSFRTLP